MTDPYRSKCHECGHYWHPEYTPPGNRLKSELDRWKRLEQYQVDCRVILERALWDIEQKAQAATSGAWVNVMGEIREIVRTALAERP